MTIAAPTAFAGKRITGAASARVTLDGREYLNFYGAGYLALSDVPEIRDAVVEALAQGVPFSRQWVHACGAIDPVFSALEVAGAKACGTQTSVYLASGALIGAAGLACLDGSFDIIYFDESAHYNLTAAIAHSSFPSHTFCHCDADSLRATIVRTIRPGQRPLVISDGVFPTTGRIPPLDDYAAVIAEIDGQIFLDDAHGFGAVGKTGKGVVELSPIANLQSGVTLSKAYCAQGALIACSDEAAARVRRAPLIRGANSGSPLSAIAAAASLDYMARHPCVREQLERNTRYCRARLRLLGFDVIESPAPIVAFSYGNAADMIALQHRLFADEIAIHYSNYIGAGAEGVIRCAMFSDHTSEDIDRLIASLSG